MCDLNEDTEVLARLSDALGAAIDQVEKNTGIDFANIEVRCTVRLMSGVDHTPLTSEILIHDSHDGFCAYCGSRTYNYDKDRMRHVCAACEGKLNGS